MFFDDAAAGAQRKGDRFVPALRISTAAETRAAQTQDRQKNRMTRNPQARSCLDGACEQGWSVFLEEVGRRSVPQGAGRRGESGWSRRARAEGRERVRGGSNWLPLPFGVPAGGRRFAARVHVNGRKLSRRLPGKSEQARHQRGGAGTARRFAPPGIAPGREGRRAQQVGVSQHGRERVVEFGASGLPLTGRARASLALNELFLQSLEVATERRNRETGKARLAAGVAARRPRCPSRPWSR